MKQLIFVYNANSDLFNTLADFAHKIISPSTYACSLCALTYGNFTMKQEWKTFIQQLPLESIFLHKDEFEKRHDIQTDLPAVFIQENDGLQLIVSKEEIDNSSTLQQLQDLMLAKLILHDQHYHSHL